MNQKDYKEIVEKEFYTIWEKEQYAENSEDDELGQHHVETSMFVVPASKEEEFGEFRADEDSYQDYGNILYWKNRGNFDGEELLEIVKDFIKSLPKEARKQFLKDCGVQ